MSDLVTSSSTSGRRGSATATSTRIRNEWGEAHFPLAVGHEIAGVVEAVGVEATDYAVGDRVGVGCLVNSCGAACADGEEQECTGGKGRKVGTYNSVDVDGIGDAGRLRAEGRRGRPVRAAHPLRAGHFDGAAPLLAPAASPRTRRSPGGMWARATKVAVLGLGGLGHMGVEIAAVMGAEVTVLQPDPQGLNQADRLKLGASRGARRRRGQDFFPTPPPRVRLHPQHDQREYPARQVPGACCGRAESWRSWACRRRSSRWASTRSINGGKVITGSNIGGIRET